MALNFKQTARRLTRRTLAGIMAAASMAGAGAHENHEATAASSGPTQVIVPSVNAPLDPISVPEFDTLRTHLTNIAGMPVVFVKVGAFKDLPVERIRAKILASLDEATTRQGHKFYSNDIQSVEAFEKFMKDGYNGNPVVAPLLLKSKTSDTSSQPICVVMTGYDMRAVVPYAKTLSDMLQTFEGDAWPKAKFTPQNIQQLFLAHEIAHCVKINTLSERLAFDTIAMNTANLELRNTAQESYRETDADRIALREYPEMREAWVALRSLFSLIDKGHTTGATLEAESLGQSAPSFADTIQGINKLNEYLKPLKAPYDPSQDYVEYLQHVYWYARLGLSEKSLSAEKLGDNGVTERYAQHFLRQFEKAYPQNSKLLRESFDSAFKAARAKAEFGASSPETPARSASSAMPTSASAPAP